MLSAVATTARARLALGLMAAALALQPATAWAHSSQGWAIAIIGTLLGLLVGLGLLVLVVVSLILGKRQPEPSPGRRRYGRVACILSVILPLLDLAVVLLVSYLDMGRGRPAGSALEAMLAGALVFFGPVALLAVASVLLGRRVIKNNEPAST
jgi:hypothetical protein